MTCDDINQAASKPMPEPSPVHLSGTGVKYRSMASQNLLR